MQTTNQKGIVKLTKAQYNTLVTTGSVTDGAGNTFTYQDGYIYCTDEVEYVSFAEPQLLTPEQQAQARANIGAGSGSGGTEVYVNSVLQSTLNFDSDPQTQISAKVPNTRTIAGVDLQDNITKNELLTALNVEDGAEVNEVNDIEIDDVSCVTGTTAEIRTINGDYNASTNRLATASDISGKVNETNTANKVYGTDNSGNQTTYDVANASNVGGAVAKYDASGRLKTATPSASDDATNKDYVDSAISNSNFLINGDFQINQRGASTYSANYKYTVDRWMRYQAQGSTGTVTVNADKTITLGTSSGDNLSFVQYIEDYNRLLGLTLALSIQYSDGTILSSTGKMPSSLPNTDTNYLSVENSLGTLFLSYSTTGHFCCGYTAKPSQTQTIKYIKLEVGSVPTPLSPKPYAQELADCQRYYQRLNGYSLTMAAPRLNNQMRTLVHPIQELRVAPVVTQLATINFYDLTSSTSAPQSAIAIQAATNIGTKSGILALENYTGLTLGHIYQPTGASDFLELDAEIYIN